ncbi:hypothetical protein ACFPES_10955 [Paenibacillus sp. GCM10023248]|uniref:hypothetical protein n=1 Tax=Bacillales TaxID=1385 RepID=UPI0023796727|nr:MULTISPECIES: hypothetical protein [Bacillales]MDD9267542.1 hypothetical protein [Paenibacillus sp. MAHUQ-63]MDR6882759.1 hypothetical protein [Bacillus sp. 3255]
MSRTQAQKVRQRQVREGKADPAAFRMTWNGMNPVTKKTPTRHERASKQLHKHHARNWNQHHGDDSFLHYGPLVPSAMGIPCSAA